MISLAITNYNRSILLKEAVDKVLNNNFISEIVIMDDASNADIIDYLRKTFQNHPKVKLITRPANVGMHTNKRDAVFYCSNDWVILFDSDNIIDHKYIEAIPAIETLDPEIIYMPEKAKPNFIYTEFIGKVFSVPSTKLYLSRKNAMFDCLLNTCNYLVNRNKYLEVWRFSEFIDAADTIWFLYHWLKVGYKFTVMPNCEYFHRVHEGSGFMKNVSKNMQDADRIKKLIMRL